MPITIPVRNETDAWDLLENAIKGILPKDTFQLDIGDWTKLSITLNGEHYNSSITPVMMEAFIDLQKNIYRLFGKIYYNNPNSNILTKDQRNALEIMIKVSPGSSELVAELKDAVKKITAGAVNKMEAKHYVIIIIAAMLCTTSYVCWKEYIQLHDEANKAGIQVNLSHEETRRLEIVTSAMEQVPYVGELRADADEFRNKVLKGAKSADNLHIAGQILNKEQVSRLVKSTRSRSIEARLDGNYKIIKVDSSDIDKFTVVLMDNTGYHFPAILQNDTVNKERNMDKLQEAEWNRNYINLEVNGRKVRGEVTTATILGIKEDI